MVNIKRSINTFALLIICGFGAAGINSGQANVEISETGGKVITSISGKPVLTYHTETVAPPTGMDTVFARSGFIHPLHSPSGKVLTDDFPVGHSHQHAVFSAWTRATFKHEVVDFWNHDDKLGSASHVKTGLIDKGSFEVDLLQFSLKKGPAIREHWRISIEDSTDPFIVDVEIEQVCATDEEVYLHPYKYGGFGFRGSSHWNREDEKHFEGSMKVLTSDGINDIEKSNHTRPRWIAAYGPIGGTVSGIVIMNRPDSFRHPQPVRVHPEMPYFVFSPVVAGSFIIKPGMAYRASYRIVTFDGQPSAERIESWYRDYVEQQ